MIKSIENLKNKSPFTDKGITYSLYDLTLPTYINSNISLTNMYTCNDYDNSRFDTISSNIFNDPDLLDLLMFINDYDNPLNIMSSDIILYCEPSLVNLFKNTTEVNHDLKDSLIQYDKSTIIDSNRVNYINNDYSLPPTINSVPTSGVNVSGNNIIIG